jgi:hypothetical protein
MDAPGHRDRVRSLLGSQERSTTPSSTTATASSPPSASVGFFDASAQADEATSTASTWVREEKLETFCPNAPRITSGEVLVTETREPAAV